MYKSEEIIIADNAISPKRNESLSMKKNASLHGEETKNMPLVELKASNIPVNECNYVEKLNSTCSRCVLCDCKIFNCETKNHVENKDHAEAKKRYACENFEFRERTVYRCECCDRKIGELDNLCLNAKRIGDASCCVSSRDEAKKNLVETKKKLNEIPAVSRASSHWSIVEIKNGDYRCIICDCYVFLSSFSQIEAHRAEKSHSSALKIYEHVVSIGKIFYCEICKLFVLDIKELRTHVKKTNHLESVLAFENSKQSKFIENGENFEIFENTRDIEVEKKMENFGIENETERFEITKKLKNEEIAGKFENLEVLKNSEKIEISKNSEILEISKKSKISEVSKKSVILELPEKSEISEFSKKSENTELPKKSDFLVIFQKLENLENSKNSGNLELSKKPENMKVFEKLENSKFPKELPNPEFPKKPEDLEFPKKSEIPEFQKNPEPPKTPENLIASFDPRLTIDYCVFGHITRGYTCNICEKKLSCSKDIEEHIIGTEHELSIEKYGCECIRLVEANSYWCDCCDCKLCGKMNIFSHLRGKRHTMCLSAMKKSQQADNDDESLAKSPSKLSKILSTVISAEFEKLLQYFQSKSMKRHFGRDTMSRRCMTQMQNISCNFCSVTVSNSAELHSHLANHLSDEFVNSKYEKRDKMAYSRAVRGMKSNSDKENNKEPEKPASDGTYYPEPMNLGNEDSETESEDDKSVKDRRKKNLVQMMRERLYYDKDYIYDIREKLKSVELGMKLCFVNDNKTIYCLICCKNVASTLQLYFEHLSSLDHTANLREMERDDSLFDRLVGQYSELKLAHEYMEEISDEHVRCLICDENIDNDDEFIGAHINNTEHAMCRGEMLINCRQSFQEVKTRMQCDWYNVDKYWCVPCSRNFTTEVDFVRHIESSKHRFATKNIDITNEILIYDFCPPCGLLWYGYHCTNAYHCDLASHKWLVRDGHYTISELPLSARKLLEFPEIYANAVIRELDEFSAEERQNERSLAKQLEDCVRDKLDRAEAYEIGSRVYGTGSSDSILDVFLDCGDMYEGSSLTSENNLAQLLITVHQCLSQDPLNWDTKEISTNRRIPVVRARHISTELTCDIFLENGLPVEMTKLLKSINDIFPPCRQMIIFLKNWLINCDLSGHERITNYAICWYVIFYLQRESILPSIAELIAMKKKSRLIDGWEVGVSRDFGYNVAESNLSLSELLARFFNVYADFDFRRDVACPFIGATVKKRCFVHHHELPIEMALYVERMKNFSNPEPLRVDSPMCIQDPFDLRDNLTRNVGKVYLRRFRAYCAKSLDVLRSS